MKKLIVTFLLLSPLPTFAASSNYQAWTCDHENYRLDSYGPGDILKCLQAAFNSTDITYDTVLASIPGGFSKKAALELDLHLKLQGYPSSNFLNADEINRQANTLKMSDLLQLLLRGWSEAYCR